MSRYLYLVRHGEQQDAEHGLPDGPLSPRGVRQANLVAERLGGVPFSRVLHSPLNRAAETAQIMADRMPAMHPEPSNLLFDCIPAGPSPDLPKGFEGFFGGITEAEIEAGKAQMADAINEFFMPSRDDVHDLLITHNFVIGWFVRHVFEAPAWRWMGIDQANCGLTIVRVRTVKPASLIVHNDLAHLPVEMRTGLPVTQSV